VFECVVNVSEGRRPELLDLLASRTGVDLLDLHTDPFHHRSVFTLAGTVAPRRLTELAVSELDLRTHSGVHPRLGVVDVVPFVPLRGSTMVEALAERDSFARWAAAHLGVPCFLYGPERSLPEVRRRAWVDLFPDVGPAGPHPTAGAICVGARPVLVAYNVYLARADIQAAKRIASLIRGPHLRALGLEVGNRVQVSMNLTEPAIIGPAQAYDAVARHARIEQAELVGLVTESVLRAVPQRRWFELDLDVDRTVESTMRRALAQRGPSAGIDR
jgi:hypothetical protein